MSWPPAPALVVAAALLVATTASSATPGRLDSPTTLCGRGGFVRDAGRVNVYRIRTPAWEGTGRTCVVVGGGTNFRITRVPTPQAGNRYGEVTTYPSIMTGCLHGLCTPKTPLPRRISAIRTEWSSLVTREAARGTWNAAYDLWFGRRPQRTGHPDAAELMVWLNHHGRCCFLAADAVRLTIGGRRWVLTHWRAYDREARVGWTYIQFRLSRPRWSMREVNLAQFIRVAVRHHLLKRWYYQLTTSFGFEVWNGGVGNTVQRFRCMIVVR